MRASLLARLPNDLRGRRLLDAGCGTGALAVEAARRGAEVVAIDIAENLIRIAESRVPQEPIDGAVQFLVGDMCDESLGEFDHVIAMDSLIHYDLVDVVDVLRRILPRTRHSVQFTFAPRTPALATMHFVGRLIPSRSSRAPAIEPVSERALASSLDQEFAPDGWRIGDTQRVSSGFYISQSLELRRAWDA